jgi:hypothetical protein
MLRSLGTGRMHSAGADTAPVDLSKKPAQNAARVLQVHQVHNLVDCPRKADQTIELEHLPNEIKENIVRNASDDVSRRALAYALGLPLADVPLRRRTPGFITRAVGLSAAPTRRLEDFAEEYAQQALSSGDADEDAGERIACFSITPFNLLEALETGSVAQKRKALKQLSVRLDNHDPTEKAAREALVVGMSIRLGELKDAQREAVTLFQRELERGGIGDPGLALGNGPDQANRAHQANTISQPFRLAALGAMLGAVGEMRLGTTQKHVLQAVSKTLDANVLDEAAKKQLAILLGTAIPDFQFSHINSGANLQHKAYKMFRSMLRGESVDVSASIRQATPNVNFSREDAVEIMQAVARSLPDQSGARRPGSIAPLLPTTPLAVVFTTIFSPAAVPAIGAYYTLAALGSYIGPRPPIRSALITEMLNQLARIPEVPEHRKLVAARQNAPAWEGLVAIVPDLDKEHQSRIVTAFLHQMASANILGLSEQQFGELHAQGVAAIIGTAPDVISGSVMRLEDVIASRNEGLSYALERSIQSAARATVRQLLTINERENVAAVLDRRLMENVLASPFTARLTALTTRPTKELSAAAFKFCVDINQIKELLQQLRALPSQNPPVPEEITIRGQMRVHIRTELVNTLRAQHIHRLTEELSRFGKAEGEKLGRELVYDLRGGNAPAAAPAADLPPAVRELISAKTTGFVDTVIDGVCDQLLARGLFFAGVVADNIADLNNGLGENVAQCKMRFYKSYQDLARSLPHLPTELRDRASTQLAQFTDGFSEIQRTDFYGAPEEPDVPAAAGSD